MFKNKKFKILLKKYVHNNRICLLLVDSNEELYMCATVNLPEICVPENHVLIKNYSENQGILEALVNQKIVRDTGVVYPTGFVEVTLVEILCKEFL